MATNIDFNKFANWQKLDEAAMSYTKNEKMQATKPKKFHNDSRVVVFLAVRVIHCLC